MGNDPPTVQYATPPRDSRRGWRLIVVLLLVALVVLAAAAGMMLYLLVGRASVTVAVTPAPAAPAAPNPPSLNLSSDPLRLTIKQRETRAVPGANDTVLIQLGDITRGQVLLSIVGADGTPILDTTSLREGDGIPFTVKGSGEFTIDLLELHNTLTGDDFAVLSVSKASANAPPLSEEEKIERLMKAVESAQGVTFIRNDESHDPKTAADHLRRKYDSAKQDVKTARDFVRHIASRSSVSGDAYRIRLPDGREVPAEQWFMDKLREIETPTASTAPTR
jgi:hypothetical protein